MIHKLNAEARNGTFTRIFFLWRGAGQARKGNVQVAVYVMRAQRARHALWIGAFLVSFGLCACTSGPTARPAATQTGSPFTNFLNLSRFLNVADVTAVRYEIAPKPGSVSKPVQVEYSIAALKARGYATDGSLIVPIFGLYAGYENQVSVELERDNGVTTPLQFTIQTPEFVDPSGIYTKPTVVTPRPVGTTLGFDFIYMKSSLFPIIIDTDGEIRWAATQPYDAISSAFVNDGFVIGDPSQPSVYRVGLDGTVASGELPSNIYTDFNHDVIPGKSGFLAEVDEADDGVTNIESNVIEFSDFGPVSILNRWDLGAILSAYMTTQGDDAAAFVRPSVDWFHSNSAIYDPQDDSVIVSSRENFVMKIDYSTGNIVWILGDPTKYWYTFPSLRAKALTLAPGGLYPIGQHGLSLLPNGQLMLFNDGLGSLNEPAGTPAGETRTYSAVSAYAINEKSMTATNTWNYEAGQSIFSPICGSAYAAGDGSLLIDYVTADNYTETLLVGLNANHDVAFEFEYQTSGCDTSWNARPVPLADLVINH